MNDQLNALPSISLSKYPLPNLLKQLLIIPSFLSNSSRHLALRAMKPDIKLNKNNMYLNIENDCVEKGRDELFPSQILKTF